MRVYRSAGDVMRCPTCGNVAIVAVVIRERIRVHLEGVRWIEPVARLMADVSELAAGSSLEAGAGRY
jgi:hypothetical protein